MFCSGCGKQLPDGSSFCSGCGKSLSSAASNTGTQVTNTPDTSQSGPELITTTTGTLDGYKITNYIGTVTGTAIYLVGGMLGGGMANQEKLFGGAYQSSLTKMKTKAQEMNADAIIGLTVNFTGAANTGSVIVALVGTAVKIQKIN